MTSVYPPKTKSKEGYNEVFDRLDTYPMENLIFRWLGDKNEAGEYNVSLEDRTLLFRFNKECFTKIFGKQYCTQSHEFRYFVWVLSNGVVIYTARGKGTHYEIPKSWTAAQAKQFVHDILKLIKDSGV